MDVTDRPVGRVSRVSGPVVHVTGLMHPVRYEFVEVGVERRPGEIISLEPGQVVVQVYEYTGGVAVGDPVRSSGTPLTIELGPGLLGGIHDGLLRPLAEAEDLLGVRPLVRPAVTSHEFRPSVEVGTTLGAGEVIGTVVGTTGFEHLLVVPPDGGGRLTDLVDPGTYRSDDVVATIDGVPVRYTSSWPIRRRRPATRRPDRIPFVTGQRVLDVLEPIARGSSATVIGGFGEGKTMLLEQIAKWGDADVVIYVGCGERGNEMADLIEELSGLADPRTGRALLDRTVILANTSNMPVMAREASIYSAVTIAEYFRDMGRHAVIIADSTSRWAEARRELAGRTGAIPAEQGYPADLPSSLAAFYERAGRVTTTGGLDGAVTIVTSVSPPGGDVTEPVAAHTQRFVQAVWALDRDLAYARHYPAISWDRSFSRDGDEVARWHAANGDPDWAVRRARLQAILSEADRLEGIADLVGLGALPTAERLTLLGGRIVREAILQQSALSETDASCSLEKQSALVSAVLDVLEAARELGRTGVPAAVIEGFDFGPLIRAKDEVGPDDAEGVHRIADRVRHDLEGLRT